jgi:hypothetical protein
VSTLRVPSGVVETIREIDLPNDQVVTRSGRWNVEDLIPVPRPDRVENVVAMERWLNGPDFQLLHRARIDTATMRCGTRCGCEHCYTVAHLDLASGQRISRHHWVDNSACYCQPRGCECLC